MNRNTPHDIPASTSNPAPASMKMKEEPYSGRPIAAAVPVLPPAGRSPSSSSPSSTSSATPTHTQTTTAGLQGQRRKMPPPEGQGSINSQLKALAGTQNIKPKTNPNPNIKPNPISTAGGNRRSTGLDLTKKFLNDRRGASASSASASASLVPSSSGSGSLDLSSSSPAITSSTPTSSGTRAKQAPSLSQQ